ncbi:hypothetical protein ABEF95_008617 [Exophiala dermatitidis]
MAPRPLKRQKTNPTEDSKADATQAQAADVPLPTDTPPTTPGSKSVKTAQQGQRPQSWIALTWPRKAAPLAEVARESVSSASTVARETASIIKDKAKTSRSPSLATTLGRSSANRSRPVDATTTIVNATSDSSSPNVKKNSSSDVATDVRHESTTDDSSNSTQQRREKANGADSDPGHTTEDAKSAATDSQAQESQSTWLGWLSRKDGGNVSGQTEPYEQQPESRSSMTVPPTADTVTSDTGEAQPPTDEESKEILNVNNKRSWFQMWSSDSSGPMSKKEETAAPPSATDPPEPAKGHSTSRHVPLPDRAQTKTSSQASSLETSPPPVLPEDGTKSSGWVFWSRDRKRLSSTKPENEPHVGEIAVSDTPSQTRPRRASISLQDEATRPVVEPPLHQEQSKDAAAQKSTTPKPVAQQTPKAYKTQKKNTHSVKDSATKVESPNAAAVVRDPVEVSTPRTASPAPSKESANLLLPPIKETLSYEETPSLLQQLTRLLYYTKEPELKHVSLVRDPPRIRNALAIGVHGYFPAPLIRTVLGQPTGTSIKFADMAAKCIKNWTRGQGYDCEVKSAALEGEGRIAERVELLWKLLLNWIDEIRRSDFVMVACHSQGVPVAIMLVAKLLQFGCISSARVGICAMAGVNLGPFQEYKSRWISGSAGELFEFSDPDSKVSKSYHAAIEEVLRSGLVKVTFVGSIDDQLVSLESSIFAPLSHPHIYRAVFIDSRIHAPNFLSHLVGFALKLLNVGVPDHGLLRELSSPLAGSLYSGEGHSRIYEDDAVYDIAISFALETTSLKDVPLARRQTSNSSSSNPYILPFAMRGILEEDYVKKELQEEARELLAQFDDWRPTTKALKDVKFRLEGIRSKL